MAARAISSATISFGLVAIPIKIYTATQSKDIRFSMLHAADKSRLKQQYVCHSCQAVVDRKDTVKGYEYARGQYVVMTDDEIKALETRSDRTIAIEEFIPISTVDPLYFEKSNLLGPDKGGAKPYRLLRKAMAEAGRVAIGRFASRGRQQLALIRPTEGGLVLHGLFHADEVRSFDDIELGDDTTIKKPELDLARQLIDQLSGDAFEAERYEDEYRQRLLAAIERKVSGEEVVIMPEVESTEHVIDLVAALKASIASRERSGTARATRKAPKAKGKPTRKKTTARRKPATR